MDRYGAVSIQAGFVDTSNATITAGEQHSGAHKGELSVLSTLPCRVGGTEISFGRTVERGNDICWFNGTAVLA
jgi:hypothetical protein